nr:unnamed protein product [Digitaria exilis]
MARRRAGPAAAVPSPAVLGTLALMVLVYYSTLFVFLDHWLGLATPAGAAHAAAISLAVAACFLSFVCAAAADPGSVPSSFAPDAEAAQGQQGLKSRYCDKCCVFKPPRSHHCKDHHCVWINNCVGYANYKAFIICVLNAAIGSLYSFVIFLCDLLLKEHEFDILYVKLVYILGPNILCWLCPTATGHLKDGTEFQITNN